MNPDWLAGQELDGVFGASSSSPSTEQDWNAKKKWNVRQATNKSGKEAVRVSCIAKRKKDRQKEPTHSPRTKEQKPAMSETSCLPLKSHVRKNSSRLTALPWFTWFTWFDMIKITAKWFTWFTWFMWFTWFTWFTSTMGESQNAAHAIYRLLPDFYNRLPKAKQYASRAGGLNMQMWSVRAPSWSMSQLCTALFWGFKFEPKVTKKTALLS